ncbi:MAG: hypothetical protein PHT31_05275 [Candidatus Omnitrophica bacterium]|nr:hypothetical protein [Candidatus Omnitrophota bacterium]MDD5653554.1 hypothetical protein [Candidatus Omnitrophota bacterium]
MSRKQRLSWVKPKLNILLKEVHREEEVLQFCKHFGPGIGEPVSIGWGVRSCTRMTACWNCNSYSYS